MDGNPAAVKTRGLGRGGGKQAYCLLCERAIPQGPRILVCDVDAGMSWRNSHRLASLHDDCWERVAGAVKAWRKAAS